VATGAAREFAASWSCTKTVREMETLMQQAPVIPKALDVDLLRSVEEAFGSSLRARDDLKRDARAAFWSAIRARVPASTPS
jgi:hypothetical protein